jgi:hypothetical protein
MISVTHLDHFDLDLDLAFSFDVTPDPTVLLY